MYLGLDLGTSSLKALLVDDSQKVLAEHSVPLSVDRPLPGWSEQNPASWIAALREAVAALRPQADLEGLRAIGLAGHMHGATLIGASGAYLRPCMLWNDTRAHTEAAQMDADPQFRQITGNIVFPGFTAPKVEWVRRNEPAIFDAIDKVLLPKDALRLFLTGEAVSEMSDAAGTSWLDTGTRDWSDALLEACHLSRDHMPALVEGADVSGQLRPKLAEELGLPVVPVAGGAGDNAAAAIGTGAVTPGTGFLSLGTSGVLFVSTPGFSPDPETAVHTFCHAVPETWHQMGVILAATDSLEWAARLTGQTAADLTQGSIAAPGRPLFLPYLGGERTPHNDAMVRGLLSGIEHATDADALGRAVMEGVAFAFRDSLDALAATGTKVERLLAVGGGARSDLWLQICATALDVPLERPVGGAYGAALGACRLAMMADGAGPEVATAPTIETVIEPAQELREAFDEAQARYRSAYAAAASLA